MSKKRSQAERRRRKLRKREERRRRSRRSRHEPWTRSESVDEAQRRAMLMKVAEMMQQLYPPCSEAVAEDFTSEAEDVSEHLGSVAASGRRALEQWPEAPETQELRTLLLDIVDAAESDGHRWEVLARRFETLAQGEWHAHLVDGRPVRTQHVADDDDDQCDSSGADDIPY